MIKLLAVLLWVSFVLGDNPLHRNGHFKRPAPELTPEDYRLPQVLSPISYDVTFNPIFENRTFTGTTTITANVIKDSNVIVLSRENLFIRSITVTVNFVNIQLNSTSTDSILQFLYIYPNTLLKQNDYLKLDIDYTGFLNQDNEGFYRAYYNESGTIREIGTTQFESTYARQAFPCLDEPGYKATFTAKIIRPKNYTSIFNTKLTSTISVGSDKEMDTFEATPQMSTYLVAFIVSQYGFVEVTNNNIIHRVYARNDAITQGRGNFSLDTSVEMLNILAGIFNIPYRLNKIYQAGIPDDFYFFGAMENWGLVTYKNKYLLRSNASTTSEIQSIATIITHEYSHQWCGDLVSPAWWSVVWLSEGFATYYETFATDKKYPEWSLPDQWIPNTFQWALDYDQNANTRPMTYNVGSPEAIESVFDTVAYEKAGSVIKMTQAFLTEPVFSDGVSRYLNNRSLNSATPDDLFAGWQDALDSNPVVTLNHTVKEIWDTWHLQAGYPLLSVTINIVDRSVNVSQSRFVPNGDTSSAVWIIPLNYVASTVNGATQDFSNTRAVAWLDTAASTRVNGITVDQGTQWIIFNKRSAYYYRVNYEAAMWTQITSQLTSDYRKIDLYNRAQLVDDIAHLADSEQPVNYTQALNLFQYIKDETDYTPLQSFFNAIKKLDRLLAGYSATHSAFASNVAQLITTAFVAYGNINADYEHINIFNRDSIIFWSCKFNSLACTDETGAELENVTPELNPDIENVVYSSGNRGNTNYQLKWDNLYNLYNDPTTEKYKRARILTGMGCTSESTVHQRMLNMTIGEDPTYKFLPEDLYSAMISVYQGTYEGTQAALTFFLQNYDAYSTIFTSIQQNNVLDGISSRLTQKSSLDELTTFKNGHSLNAEQTNAIDHAILNVVGNMKWFCDYGYQIAAYYNTNLSDTCLT